MNIQKVLGDRIEQLSSELTEQKQSYQMLQSALKSTERSIHEITAVLTELQGLLDHAQTVETPEHQSPSSSHPSTASEPNTDQN